MSFLLFIKKFFRCLVEKGPLFALGKTIHFFKKKQSARKFRKENSFKPRTRGKTIDQTIKFSILTPLYNTPERFLREMIESVRNQTYPNWELCLCDGSDEEHSYVEQFCTGESRKDPRIVYTKLTENKGISENTNACLRIATGDYIAILDHDDLLHPDVLYETAKAIYDKGADFIYTDEAQFTDSPDRFFNPHLKPDFTIDGLRAQNYICHFNAFKRSLIQIVGEYNPEYDGSQDHDMVLRLTEKAACIVHIPRILYYWRVHSDSVASSIEVKPYAVTAAHRAVEAHLKRCGLSGKVSSIHSFPTYYKIDYEIPVEPLITVVIYGDCSARKLKRCITYMEDMAEYHALEVCIVEGNTAVNPDSVSLKDGQNLVFISGEEQRERSIKELLFDKCHGEHFVFLNGSAIFKSKSWVREMLMYSQREDVGAVGVKLLDRYKRIYSAGIVMDETQPEGFCHACRGMSPAEQLSEERLIHARNMPAVDRACMMISREKLSRFFDNGSDLNTSGFNLMCMNINANECRNVWIPFVETVICSIQQQDL